MKKIAKINKTKNSCIAAVQKIFVYGTRIQTSYQTIGLEKSSYE